MAHQTEAAEGCVRVPADGGTSSLECVSIWLSWIDLAAVRGGFTDHGEGSKGSNTMKVTVYM